MKLAVFTLSVVGGCVQYSATPPAYQRAASAHVGCLDVTVARLYEAPSPTVAYRVANTCDHPATFDLSHVDAVASIPDGGYVALRTGRRSSQRILNGHYGGQLEARGGDETRITYLDSSLGDGVSLCVDLGGVDHTVDYAPRWTCVR